MRMKVKEFPKLLKRLVQLLMVQPAFDLDAEHFIVRSIAKTQDIIFLGAASAKDFGTAQNIISVKFLAQDLLDGFEGQSFGKGPKLVAHVTNLPAEFTELAACFLNRLLCPFMLSGSLLLCR